MADTQTPVEQLFCDSDGEGDSYEEPDLETADMLLDEEEPVLLLLPEGEDLVGATVLLCTRPCKIMSFKYTPSPVPPFL